MVNTAVAERVVGQAAEQRRSPQQDQDISRARAPGRRCRGSGRAPASRAGRPDVELDGLAVDQPVAPVRAGRRSRGATRTVNTIARYAAAVDLDAYVAEHRGEWRRLEELSRRRRLSAATRPTSWWCSTSGRPPTCRWCAAARRTRCWSPGCRGWCCGPGRRSPAAPRSPGQRRPVLHRRVPRRCTGARWWWAVVGVFVRVWSAVLMWYVAAIPRWRPLLSPTAEIEELGRQRLRRLLQRVPAAELRSAGVDQQRLSRRPVPGRRGAVVPVIYVLAATR